MATAAQPAEQRLAVWIDGLQAAGRYTFTRDEVADHSARSPVAVDATLRRLKQKSRIKSPRRGFFVVVPIEYRATGCPPASWFVDDLMRFLGQPYYVGILSAAALHGSAHQQPMTFQVVTDRPTRRARAGRVRIDFHTSSVLGRTPVVAMPTETGSMRVATPEATAFDLVRYQAAAGFLDNVATVLAGLVERMRTEALADCARQQPTPDAQRLGYLLDRSGHGDLAHGIWTAIREQRRRKVLLVPRRARGRAKADERWGVVPNWRLRAES